MTAAKVVQKQRRKPSRSGSRDTVEAIFEATARILQAQGREGLSTNRIAQVAGVSIGALYGYFPNKRAILLAMARRELDAMRDRVAAALTSAGNEPEAHPVRRAIRALVEGYTARGPVRRILMETLFSEGGSEEMARPVHEIADVILSNSGHLLGGMDPPSRIGLYVLTRAVDGVIRTATYESEPFVGTAAFENEIMRLVTGYLAARPEPGDGADTLISRI